MSLLYSIIKIYLRTYITDFAHPCDEIPDKKQLQGGRIYFVSVWGLFVTAEKACWQGQQAMGEGSFLMSPRNRTQRQGRKKN